MDWLQEPLEEIQWALLHWLAGLCWALDRLFLTGGVLIHSVRKWITNPRSLIDLVLTQLLQDPTGSQLLKAYIAGGVLLALLLAAFWFFLRPLLGGGAGAPAEVRKIFLWLAVAGFLFSNGPAFAGDLEAFRAQLSSGAYQVAVAVNTQVGQQGYNNTGGEMPITGSQPFSPTVTLFPNTTHVYPPGTTPEYTGIDVAAAYLLAGQDDINGVANGGTGLPGGAEQAYFCNPDPSNCSEPWPSGYSEENRQAALQKALNGVIRMGTGIVPAIFAVQQAVIFLALAIAAAILLFSLPIALVFAFFTSTEVIALAVVQAYIRLLIKTYVTATILALFMGFLVYWGGGNWVAFLGMSLLTDFFTLQLALMALQTITQALNVVTQSVGQATGTQLVYVDPPRMARQTAEIGATVALAGATGGAGVAAGSLVSGLGWMLGMPGAGVLGTAIAVGARRHAGETAREDLERAQPAARTHMASPPLSSSASTPPATQAPGGPTEADSHEPIAVAEDGAPPTVIEGEWYEIRAARQRRERANRWLAAQGINPITPTVEPDLLVAQDAGAVDSPTESRLLTRRAPVLALPAAALPAPMPDGPRPPVPPEEPGPPPGPLADYAQWVAWRYETVVDPRTQRSRRSKVPYNPQTGQRARSNDPQTWGTLNAATTAARAGYDGIGFMLTPDDPFVGVDLDHCYDPATGTLAPWAAEIVQTLGSYTEISPSGEGLRIFMRGALPPRVLGRRAGNVEMYDDRRFLTVTGRHLAGTPTTIEERTAALQEVHQGVFRARPAAPAPPAPAAGPGSPPLSDDAILSKIRRAKNGQAFSQLWRGETAGYPSASEADIALCGMLAFYTQDAGQIERLVAQSGLWDDKWHNRPAYRQDTIQTAISNRSGTYTGQRPDRPDARPKRDARPHSHVATVPADGGEAGSADLTTQAPVASAPQEEQR